MRVCPLDIEYRGFELGWATGLHGLLPAWKHLSDNDWVIGHLYCKDEPEAAILGSVCIDYLFKVLTRQILLGRDLSMQEMPKP